jgi:hypothetical protein
VVFKVGKVLGIFGLGKDFKDYFRKGIFFFILSSFFLILGYVAKMAPLRSAILFLK